jgi:hypothetical protein
MTKKQKVFLLHSSSLLRTEELVNPLRHMLFPVESEVKLINFTFEKSERFFLSERLILTTKRIVLQNPDALIIILVLAHDLMDCSENVFHLLMPMRLLFGLTLMEKFKGRMIFCSHIPDFNNRVHPAVSMYDFYHKAMTCLYSKAEFVNLPERVNRTVRGVVYPLLNRTRKSYTVAGGNLLAYVIYKVILENLKDFAAISQRLPAVRTELNWLNILMENNHYRVAINFPNDPIKCTDLRYLDSAVAIRVVRHKLLEMHAEYQLLDNLGLMEDYDLAI